MNKRYAAFALIALALVTAGAARAQSLKFSPSSVSLFAESGSSSSAQQTITVTSSDNTTVIPFNLSPNAAWINVLSATPSGGWKTPASVTIGVNPSQLPLGKTVGLLDFSGTGVGGSGFFQTVEVDVTVSTINVQITGQGGAQSNVLNLGTYQIGSTAPPPGELFVTGDIANLTVTQPATDTWYTYSTQPFPPSLAIQVSFNPAAAATLSPGTLTGALTLTPENSAPPVTIPITLTVTASPQVTLSQVPLCNGTPCLVFNWQRGGANQNQQFLTLSSNAAQAISLNISAPGVPWVTLPSMPVSIAANGTIQVPVTVPQLAGDAQNPGANNGLIQMTIVGGGALFDNGTTSKSIPIELLVSSFPMLFVSPFSLSFSSRFGSNTTPASQILVPTSSGTAMTYIATGVPSDNWVSVKPAGNLSTDGGSFTVAVNPAGLLPGTYTSTVTVTPQANGSGQSPISIPLTLTVSFPNVLLTSVPVNPLVCNGSPCLVFGYQTGQATPPTQTVYLSTTTGAPLNYTITPPAATAAWIQVGGPLTGTTDNTSFTVSIVPSGIPSPLPSSPEDATINIVATDPTTNATVNSISIDVKLFLSATPQLVVSATQSAVTALPPLLLSTWPNSSKYTGNDQGAISVYLSSSQPVTQELTNVSTTGAVSNQASTGDWLSLTSPGPGTPTSFTIGAVRGDATHMPYGTYYGVVSVTATAPPSGTPVADSPVSIPVQFTVNAAKASVGCGQTSGSCSLSFTQTKGGQLPASQVVQVTTDIGSLAFEPVVNTGLNNWLTVSGITGPTPGSFNVSVDASSLPIGTAQGAIYVDIPNADGSPIRIPVTFQVNGGTICAGSCSSPTQSLNFAQVIGGATPPAQPVAVVSSPSSVTYTIGATVTTPANGTWLVASISAGGGVTPGTVSVSVNAGSLGAGTYKGIVTITSPGATNSPIQIPVTLTVQQATLLAPTTTLQFSQLAGGPAPAAQQIAVTSTPGPIPFSVSTGTNAPWLMASVGSSGTSGTTPGTVTVSVNSGLLSAGQYSGVITIASAGAIGSPIYVPVLLNVGAAVQLGVSQSTLAFAATVGQATTPQTVQLTSTATTPYTVVTSTTDKGAWLSVNPSSGTAGTSAITLTVSANTQNLAVGSYSGTVTISSPSSLTPAIIGVSLTVTAVPTPVVTAVANAASWVAGAVSPGENIVIGGTGIGPTPLVQVQQLTSAGRFPTTLGNTQVFFDGIAAPIIYVSATQTSVMVPYEIAGRTSTNLQVFYSGVQSVAVPYNVVSAAPGIYALNTRGFGPGAIVNQDTTINGPNNPAAKGSVVAIYMTGEGVTNPASTDGAIAYTTGNPLNKPILAVTATVAGQPAAVQYYGSAPGIVYGVMQVNITIPAGTPSGAQPVLINVGNYTTPAGVTVAVQ